MNLKHPHKWERLISPSFLVWMFFLCSFSAFSQEKCATVDRQNWLYRQGLIKENDQEFESWLKRQLTLQKQSASNKQVSAIYTIPVVVHIIHNGEPYGDGANIPNEQVFSQIEILNRDFRRTNLDAHQTLAEFSPVAADIEIEFVLAKRDPNGLSTNGITRAEGNKDNYRFSEHGALSDISFWPSEDYLNIWVAPLEDNLLGWAQFPLSNLEGLDNVNTTRKTDGVVIDFEFFGEGYNARDFSKGRTATHEVGHFLGLRHIWGDGGCNADDFCEDTPPADGPMNGCDLGKTTCGNLDMIQNYMDYTNDVCMNLFTQDQKHRMRTVMENSPRRFSLLTSLGAVEPEPFQLDAAVVKNENQLIGLCDAAYQPTVQIVNLGLETITQYKVLLQINDEFVEEISTSQNLQPGQTQSIAFSQVQLDTGLSKITFRISSTNNKVDDNPTNNEQEIFVYFQPNVSVNEENLALSNWSVYNPDGKMTWQIDAENNVASINLFDYKEEFGLGENDWLLSPSFDLSTFENPVLAFEYAYAEGNQVDALKVMASTNCGQSFTYNLFERSHLQLATAYSSAATFVPVYNNDWTTTEINLSALTFFEQTQFAFVSTNGDGNAIYIKNVRIKERYEYANDLEILHDTAPPQVNCGNTFSSRFRVRNSGSSLIENININYFLKNELIESRSLPVNLSPNQSTVLRSPEISFDYGNERSELLIEVSISDGFADENASNNSIQIPFEKDDRKMPAPFRFDINQEQNEWFRWSTDRQNDWLISEEAFDPRGTLKISLGESSEFSRYWLISPTFDLDESSAQSLGIELYYQIPYRSNERIRVYLSDNCGLSYDYIMFDRFLADLPFIESNAPSQIASTEDFIYIPIDIGTHSNKNNLKIAIEIIASGGNELYLQNIALRNSRAEPIKLENNEKDVIIFPNPAKSEIYLLLDFELAEENVQINFLDLKGNLLKSSSLKTGLNQQYSIDVSDLANALYILQVRSLNKNISRKIMIQR